MSLKDLIAKAAAGDATALAEFDKVEERTGYLESELSKAIAARDKAKGDVKVSLTEREELETLRLAKAEAEEAQLKAKGDYETLKARLEKEKGEADARTQALEQRFAKKAIETAFVSAADLFGSKGRTVLPPDFAMSRFAEHVKFVPGENGQDGSVLVHDLKGDAITKDGKPVPFAEAMGRLIDSWPAKEQILRAAGRTGSGSTGAPESTDLTQATRADIVKRAQAGDPNAIKHLEQTRPAGSVVSGSHWEKKPEQKTA